ncbi:hypothetical protein BV11031_19215 [Bacillus vallismortis]|nr:hypothetical protein BV11031_19215 [Bacillus vallismortis]
MMGILFKECLFICNVSHETSASFYLRFGLMLKWKRKMQRRYENFRCKACCSDEERAVVYAALFYSCVQDDTR